MNKFIKATAFLKYLFDQERVAEKAAVIVEAIWAACSPRLSDIAQHMAGTEAANYKMIQRFLHQADPKAALVRLFQADAPFVIGDPTEMPRPQDQVCGDPQRRQDARLLAIALGDALSRLGAALWLCHLFLPDDCATGALAQPVPLGSL